MPRRHIIVALALALPILTLLAACDTSETERLQNEVTRLENANRALRTERDHLATTVSELEAETASLAAQVEELSATEANLWAAAQTALANGDNDTAETRLNSLLQRFPDGQRANDAKAALVTINEERATHMLGEANWYANNTDLNNAETLYKRVIELYGNTAAAAGARDGLANLAMLKAQEAAMLAGFLLEDVRTFWTNERSFGQSLIVPEVRFKIRPSGSEPISYLQLMAVFSLETDSGLEQLGDATKYIVGSTDVPIPAGTRKEAWLTSGVGYVETNIAVGLRFLQGNAPDTRVDLYYKTNFRDDWTHFSQLPVSKDFKL